MKIRSVKTVLILIILNLMIYSFSFAQVDFANVIVEDRIDELWTTGKLNIGQGRCHIHHLDMPFYFRINLLPRYQIYIQPPEWLLQKCSRI